MSVIVRLQSQSGGLAWRSSSLRSCAPDGRSCSPRRRPIPIP